MPDFIPADMSWEPGAACVSVVSVSASSAGGSNAAANTLDRDLRSRWTPAGDGASITFDLGRETYASGASVVWYALRRARASCTVETSIDGKRYETAWAGTLKGRGTGTAAVEFSPRQARYLRILLSSPVSLYEVGIHGEEKMSSR